MSLIDFDGNPVTVPDNGFYGQCANVDSYKKLNRIGEGTYGIVYRARERKTKKTVALKRMRVDSNANNTVKSLPLASFREITLLKRLRHPNIVNILDIVVGNRLENIFMVMEFCECDLGTLLDNMKTPFSQAEIKSIMEQLFCGLKYCHANHVVHRDLKLPNMLLTASGELKIADFGLARLFHVPKRPMTPQVATLWYRAPELILGSKEYSASIDLWSAGCIFGELLIHQPFMPGKSEQDQLRLIAKMIGAPNERIWSGYSRLPLASTIQFPENR
ncbi:hypothetical protein H4R20_004074 [Coemansia guatemalensis]|uniref:cyclin-dependent kinase n=1 Tax=Coemansia guatemalensis TaxID=2761395 RepID=A0A9W8LS25_9FUNG|nr:hypothetical protein H4R20_004074 [Coemansia guatemalensis]